METRSLHFIVAATAVAVVADTAAVAVLLAGAARNTGRDFLLAFMIVFVMFIREEGYLTNKTMNARRAKSPTLTLKGISSGVWMGDFDERTGVSGERALAMALYCGVVWRGDRDSKESLSPESEGW